MAASQLALGVGRYWTFLSCQAKELRGQSPLFFILSFQGFLIS